MTNLINPKPRFGLDDTKNTIFDYLSNRDVAIVPNHQSVDGQWDLVQVRALILAGKTIESAQLNRTVPPRPAPQQPKAPTAPSASPTAPAAAAAQAVPSPMAQVGPAPTKSLTALQIQALKLEPLQLAALGITPQQLKVSGLTPEQLVALRVTPQRAAIMRLDGAQQTALTA
jgi:hypothetical protein